MSRSSFDKLLREARHEHEQSTLPPQVRHKKRHASPQLLLNAVLIPVVVLTFIPTLAFYFAVLAPALPLVVTLLWWRMRHEWSQPATAVALCTLTGFAIGYALLFWQHAPQVLSKLAEVMQRLTP
jgi:hypothetical protein